MKMSYCHHSITLSGIYCLVIFSLQRYLRDKSPFDLRLPLACWSAFLAVFSAVGMLRTVPELFYIINEHGFHHSVCHPSMFYGTACAWTILFQLSKPIELGDTLFIVLRKQKLILLHWYHHITVMIYVFYAYVDLHSPGRWFSAMNFTVHTFMYTYYALRALRIRVPNAVNIVITSMQIIQMIIGLALHFYLLYTNRYCFCSTKITYAGIAMYLSYFILFAKFFKDTYVHTKSPKQQDGFSNRHNGSMNGHSHKKEL